jgi:hypothetical protein
MSRRNLLLITAGSLVLPVGAFAQQMSKEDKKETKEEAHFWNFAAIACSVVGVVVAITGAGLPVTAACAAAAAFCKGVGELDSKTADDPPDSNFKTLARPQVKTITLSSGNITTSDSVKVAENALVSNVAQIKALSDAMFISINRASGALLAKQPFWRRKQTELARSYASQLARLLDELPDIFARLRTSLVEAKLTVAPTASDIVEAKRMIAEHGFPHEMSATFKEIGLSNREIQDLRTGAGRLAITPAQAAFPDFLADPRIAASSRAAATRFRRYAAST